MFAMPTVSIENVESQLKDYGAHYPLYRYWINEMPIESVELCKLRNSSAILITIPYEDLQYYHHLCHFITPKLELYFTYPVVFNGKLSISKKKKIKVTQCKNILNELLYPYTSNHEAEYELPNVKISYNSKSVSSNAPMSFNKASAIEGVYKILTGRTINIMLDLQYETQIISNYCTLLFLSEGHHLKLKENDITKSNNKSCVICTDKNHVNNYMYQCKNCSQIFCYNHFMDHIRVNEMGDQLDNPINCNSNSIIIDKAMVQAFTNTMCDKIASHLANSKMHFQFIFNDDIIGSNLLLKQIIQKFSPFLKSNKIKSYSLSIIRHPK